MESDEFNEEELKARDAFLAALAAEAAGAAKKTPTVVLMSYQWRGPYGGPWPAGEQEWDGTEKDKARIIRETTETGLKCRGNLSLEPVEVWFDSEWFQLYK